MAREPNIPLFLWVATAVLVHLISGGGAEQASQVPSERVDVRRFAESVRRHVQLTANPIEVALYDATEESPAVGAAQGPDDPDDSEVPDEAIEEEATEAIDAKEDGEQDVADEKLDDEELEEKLAKQPPAAEEKKEPEPEEKKEEEEEQAEFPQLQIQNRIAVQQHVEDENQKDNPDAEFIGDHANRVAEQTQARITATDQNDPNPSPGSAYQGAAPQPGNAHVTDIAHSEDAPGELDRAPNEQAGGAQEEQLASSSTQRRGGTQQSAREVRLEGSEKGQADGSHGHSSPDSEGPAQDARAASAAMRGAEASPEVMDSPHGGFGLPRAQEGRQARREQKGRMKRLPPRKGKKKPLDFLGLGGSGRTRGGINLNLSHDAAVAAVGKDQLARERRADGERRRSKHRGSWKTLGIEKWRAAIENYNSSVKPGNQTALNTARVPFASYLNRIHNRLHPIFADSFLGSLNGLPRQHPLNRQDMKTNLEIVLDRDQGKVVKMGVTRSSGSTVFDIAALESVQAAQPFGVPPKAIISEDGNVYLHWEFHRNPYYACSTYFARPFKLKGRQKSAPPKVAPPSGPRFGPQEQPVPRTGHLFVPHPHPHSHTHAAR